ncbi:MAG: segregation/condensation protein A [Planctomycetes bacterium]|nr:segregation/condensation protein A [Planctomycetota bacterium]
MPYQVALDSFHGPLDLLLYLVKRNEVDILDIPIAPIAEQFRDYLQIMVTLDVEVAGDFLVMAATLMEIKSKLLLPTESVEAEESENDPRRELVKQLIEYRKFKDAAAALEDRAEGQQSRLSREAPAEVAPADGTVPIRRVELWDLVSAFGRLMRETLATQTRSIITDETPMHVYQAQIRKRLREEGRLTLLAVFTPPYHRSRLISIFLAILEMIKGNEIHLDQAEPFGEIWLSLRMDSEPPN